MQMIHGTMVHGLSNVLESFTSCQTLLPKGGDRGMYILAIALCGHGTANKHQMEEAFALEAAAQRADAPIRPGMQ